MARRPDPLMPIEQAPIPVRVTAVRREGSISVGYGTDDAGRPILFAGDPRMMASIAAELEDGSQSVTVTVESWQILAAHQD